MHSLVYHSTATANFTEEDVEKLADKAALFNEEHDITGFLNFKAGQIVQYLEGSKDSLSFLMTKINMDNRHDVRRVLYLEERENRLFANWSMRYFGIYEMNTVGFGNIISFYLEDSIVKSFGEPWAKQKVNGALFALIRTL